MTDETAARQFPMGRSEAGGEPIPPDPLPPTTDRISVDHPARMRSGVYFGLPDAAYHQAFALSSHGIKWLRQSTLDFWVRSPLNPNAAEVENDTDALKIGRAYDARIIEGRETFERNFAPMLDKDEYPNALDTNNELIEAIAASGGPLRGMKGKRKEELISIMLQYDPGAEIWGTLVKEYEERHPGKTKLPRVVMDRIEVAAKMIEAHPQLCKAFSGGTGQTSVFWEDEETGVPCKARFDYLKYKAIIDLKSFENIRGLPVLDAIARAYGIYEYNLQAAHYLDAATQIARLIDGRLCFGDVDEAFLKGLQEDQPKQFMFVWQQKGPAPVARGWVPPTGSLDVARMYIAEAKETFAQCWRTYGTDPWVDIADVYTADDAEIPLLHRFRR